MKWSLDVNYFQFIDGAILFNYVLTDFLAGGSIFNQLSLDAVEKQMIYNSIPISKWNLESAGEL